jgi:hypothetical protein
VKDQPHGGRHDADQGHLSGAGVLYRSEQFEVPESKRLVVEHVYLDATQLENSDRSMQGSLVLDRSTSSGGAPTTTRSR